MLGESLGEIKFGGTSREFLQMMFQFRLKRGLLAGDFISCTELLQSRHQRLGHKNAAVTAKVSRGIRQRKSVDLKVSGSGHGGRKWREKGAAQANRKPSPDASGSLPREAQCQHVRHLAFD